MNRRTAIFLIGLLSESGARLCLGKAPTALWPPPSPNLSGRWRAESSGPQSEGQEQRQENEGLANGATRQTLSLDGMWEIVFDQRNEGRAGGWYKRENFEGLANKRAISVPSCWETIEKDYEGVAWYGLRFRVPAAWSDKVIRLRFGAVNYRAEVWINDHPAGFHDGGYTPFELRVENHENYCACAWLD